MELDDLRRTWNKQTDTSIKNVNPMELIHRKSYGPVAALKKSFRKQMRLMLLMPVLVFATQSTNAEGLLKSILFWSYLVFCLLLVMFFYLNYRIAARMEVMQGNVRANLERQTLLLQKRLRWKMLGLPLLLLFLLVLVEVLPYFQHYSMIDKWHSLSAFVRFGAYALFLLLQYLASRRLSERRFGAHLNYLQKLVKEMGD